jgi:hypothetical protein
MSKQREEKVQKSFFKKILGTSLFVSKYITTSLCIFGVLMVASNYSAYFKIAQSIIYAEEMKVTKQSLIESVAASEISESISDNQNTNTQTFRQLDNNPAKNTKSNSFFTSFLSAKGFFFGKEL